MTSSATTTNIRCKRVYEPADDDDGMRVLVDRLWPRGLSKKDARLDLWLKDAAPSPALRKWFGHEAPHWAEFRRRYEAELAENPEVERLCGLVDGGPVTLLYAARDVEHNHALVLAEHLRGRLGDK